MGGAQEAGSTCVVSMSRGRQLELIATGSDKPHPVHPSTSQEPKHFLNGGL